jgi:hypothetical protein
VLINAAIDDRHSDAALRRRVIHSVHYDQQLRLKTRYPITLSARPSGEHSPL